MNLSDATPFYWLDENPAKNLNQVSDEKLSSARPLIADTAALSRSVSSRPSTSGPSLCRAAILQNRSSNQLVKRMLVCLSTKETDHG